MPQLVAQVGWCISIRRSRTAVPRDLPHPAGQMRLVRLTKAPEAQVVQGDAGFSAEQHYCGVHRSASPSQRRRDYLPSDGGTTSKPEGQHRLAGPPTRARAQAEALAQCVLLPDAGRSHGPE